MARFEVVAVVLANCAPCVRFEPMLANWAQHLADEVHLFYLPAMFPNQEAPEIYLRAFFVAQQLGVKIPLKEIKISVSRALYHYPFADNPNGKMLFFQKLSQPYSDFGRALGHDEYMDIFQSAEIGEKAEATPAFLKRIDATSVPALVINGKYLVNGKGEGKSLEDLLRIADALIAHERKQVAASSLPLLPMTLLAIIIIAVPATFWLNRHRHKTPLRKNDQ